MRKRYFVALLLAAFTAAEGGGPIRPAYAQAGVPTTDAGVLAATLEQVQNGLQQLQTLQSQLQTAMSLVNAVKGGRGMDVIAGLLNQAGVRDMFPTELVDLLQGTAEIAATADSIRQSVTISSYPGNDFYLSELTSRGNRLTRDMATAESLFSTLSKRSKGLDDLRKRLGTVTDPAEVDQLNARIAYETSAATNDLQKLQVLSMQQRTLEKLDEQRAGEAARKAAECGYDFLTKGSAGVSASSACTPSSGGGGPPPGGGGSGGGGTPLGDSSGGGGGGGTPVAGGGTAGENGTPVADGGSSTGGGAPAGGGTPTGGGTPVADAGSSTGGGTPAGGGTSSGGGTPAGGTGSGGNNGIGGSNQWGPWGDYWWRR